MNRESGSERDMLQADAMGAVQRSCGWFISIGVVLIVLGILAIGMPIIAALAIELLLGWLVVLGGIAQVVNAFRSRQWGGFLLALLSGILYLVVGILLLAHPVAGVLTLTLLLAVFFVIEGVFKIILAVQLRPAPNWGWMLCSGIVALLLGGIIWAEWPSAAAWVIGLLVGINMIFGGWSMVAIGLTARCARD